MIDRSAIAISVFIIGTISLSGCFCWKTNSSTDGSVQHYFGYTKVVSPKTATSEEVPFEVKDVSIIGLAAGSLGFIVGYSAQKNISLPPENSFYIEVSTEEQFNALQEFLKNNKEAKLWIQKRTGDR